MQRDLGQLWDRTLDMMRHEVMKPSFEAWLKNTAPLALDGDVLTVAVPNQFTKDWVESRYAPVLHQVLRSVTGRHLRVNFRIVEHMNTASPPSSDEGTVPPSTPSGNGTSGRGFNPRYTFDTFVVGPGNRFAHAACVHVSEAPARAYNPLFIYGGVGLGKTHLMQAIGHFLLQSKPRIKVIYVSSETFTNELIAAIRDGRTADFRNRYRSVDVLLLDDVQFVAGKESTQEEFFHTFDTLHQAAKQIVISSDRPPREISTLEARLRTRFEWGLIADIQPADLETRIAILRKKASSQQLVVPSEVLTFIATSVETNIRELEGALLRVVALSSLTGRPVDLELTEEALKNLFPDPLQRAISIDLIQRQVAAFYQLTVDDLKEKKRTRAVSYPRHVAMYLCRELTDFSLPRIGHEFGGRDHTTVIHACERIRGDLKESRDLQGTLRSLVELIQGSTR
ncbi:MAG TPA: chromosomal replication initiator protein DnaA [Clostridiales bacterium UBA8153]|nr:chromosomal replication initiator protein DnaA [Clostridiales bacterium UBA8153]